MTKRFTFDTTIERGDDEIELRVAYTVAPGRPARLYGDYPHPAEDDEIEVVSVKFDGAEFALTDAEEAAILRECEERAAGDLAEEYAAEQEWRAQDRRDRLLMDQWECDE